MIRIKIFEVQFKYLLALFLEDEESDKKKFSIPGKFNLNEIDNKFKG